MRYRLVYFALFCRKIYKFFSCEKFTYWSVCVYSGKIKLRYRKKCDLTFVKTAQTHSHTHTLKPRAEFFFFFVPSSSLSCTSVTLCILQRKKINCSWREKKTETEHWAYNIILDSLLLFYFISSRLILFPCIWQKKINFSNKIYFLFSVTCPCVERCARIQNIFLFVAFSLYTGKKLKMSNQI